MITQLVMAGLMMLQPGPGGIVIAPDGSAWIVEQGRGPCRRSPAGDLCLGRPGVWGADGRFYVRDANGALLRVGPKGRVSRVTGPGAAPPLPPGTTAGP